MSPAEAGHGNESVSDETADLARPLVKAAAHLRHPFFKGWTRNPLLLRPVYHRLRRFGAFRFVPVIADAVCWGGVLFLLGSSYFGYSEPLPVRGILVSVLVSFYCLCRLLMSPLPVASLLNGAHPHSRDLWNSGVGVREVVQAAGVWSHVWNLVQWFYLLLLPVCLVVMVVCFEIQVSGSGLAAHRQGLDWARVWAAAVCFFVTIAGLVVRRREFLLFLSLRLARATLRPSIRGVEKASELDLLALPPVRNAASVVPLFLYSTYILLFEFLMLMSLIPAHGEHRTLPLLIASFLLIAVTGYSLFWARRLPRDIDANIKWLTTEGQARYTAVLEKLYGEPAAGQANS